MGVDRTGAGADDPTEATEEPPPPDRRPPADRPGAEGAPSRADSRNGAAAANETGNQTAEQQSEEKTDSDQKSQETSGEQGSSAAETPEPSGTQESNEGICKDDSTSERYDNGLSHVGTDSKPDAGRLAEEIGVPKDADQREQVLEGQATTHDRDTTTETDESLGPAGAQNGAKEKFPADDAKSEIVSPPSAVDVGDRPGSTEEQTKGAPVSASDTPEPPSDSFDASGDVAAGDARELARPATDAVEAAERSPEVEARSELADRPQPDPRDHVLPTADAKQNADQASDGHQEKADPSEAAEDLGTPLTESTEVDGGRTERPDGANEQEVKSEVAPKGVDTTREQALSERLTVDGVPLHKYLDPVGAAAWSNEGVDVEPNPAGDRIAEPEKDELSRFEKMRRKAYEASDDIHDIIQDRLNEAKDIFARPPAGHTEMSTHPEMIPAPHDGISVGDAATAVVAAGVVAGEIFRRRRGKLREEKEG